MEIHLVADTNVFFECRRLEDLPWRELGYDAITVLVAKPVLDEIDKHKKSNGRTRKRALEIFGRIREMLVASKSEALIQENSPRVVLRLIGTAPLEELRETLDYSKNDDRLVGILAALCREQADHRTVLFTDDTGPASTARTLQLPFQMIKEEWRRPLEETDEQKRIRSLESDLAAYRSNEPKILVGQCFPADDSNSIKVVRRKVEPLLEAECEEILHKLRQKHPMQTSFLKPDPNKLELALAANFRFEAPSEEEIEAYQKTTYPNWLRDCQMILGNLHIGKDKVEGPIILEWPMSNDGTRPATQVRIVFEAQGPLILHRINEDEDEKTDSTDQRNSTSTSGATFPKPPKPPAFRRIALQQPLVPSSAFEQSMLKASGLFAEEAKRSLGINRLNSMFGATGEAKRAMAIAVPSMSDDFIHAMRPVVPHRHDPEAFYYDWPYSKLVKQGALVCDLWRHQKDENVFRFAVLFTGVDPARGSVLCTIHAENLPKPVTSRIELVREVEISRPMTLANTMLANC